ncbi:3-phosphoshikimate 1-carboxyvinyltransferase [Bizionia argentinensis JUB59]|uniref:3-phosphoshikimate 1-carboxyvinyltransferase n=1 Tax=Bizionia argentinensis JUB59 TaxID=1046627 RepID=G2EDJ5_9FLAO|nr:3-phosphoshikimate 1-carboxyvinyltransferase [Bizionia argentinensis]EGV43460.1 3-phosphoshikimate 1-carboxyvinyltransferase [Bizionia argentinensis JUB59]
MNLKLEKSIFQKQETVIKITGSKSESNRLLLLQALYPEIKIHNLSNSDDTVFMEKALSTNSDSIDVHHAGTAMRFLTAYFAVQENRTVSITGSQRMKERPIKILVDALNQLGANISYLENDGFPPLQIKGRVLTSSQVKIEAGVSSQYISALLLIGSKLENGLNLTLEGEITSIPYIKMTLQLLNQIGVETVFENNVIQIKPFEELKETELTVESDWSSASYFYSLIALSAIGTEVKLTFYKENSLQGDSVLAEIYKIFGVSTSFHENSISLKKIVDIDSSYRVKLNLVNAPDIAQTIAVTCFALDVSCHLSGLHTLKIKETDRLVALKTELEKLGAHVSISSESLELKATSIIKKDISIDTYNDHRMAMAFAPLSLKTDIVINDWEVVSKSYPTFWNDLKSIGINQFE